MKIWWTYEILWTYENIMETWKHYGHMTIWWNIWWTHENMIDTTVQIEVRRRRDNYINSGCFFLRTAASTGGSAYFLGFLLSFYCDQLFLVCTHSLIDNKIMRYQMKLLMNLCHSSMSTEIVEFVWIRGHCNIEQI